MVCNAFVFDAYGTLFDVYSVTSLCEQLFPGNGNALAMMWRAKQLQPFPVRGYKRIAVKVVDVYGNESTVVRDLSK